ncbi:MAG: CDP-alcohol phosphatidyltransferase family protein [Candidatus Binatia bacterium]
MASASDSRALPGLAPTRLWDVRLARLLVGPLQNTRVRPNHLTTVGLITGLGTAALYASGDRTLSYWGAASFVVTTVLDHADGELARATGTTSTFGHHYDRIVDLLVKIGVFVGMGVGLRHGPHGTWAVLEGIAAGISLVTIFVFRGRMAARRGVAAFRQPSFAGFELEDILYVIAPVTWLGYLPTFLLGAGIGAPIFALWIVRQYRRDG